jgi:two-component system, NarL family, nitrate/nitrite sensor histidine kinase NarQ
VDSVANAMSFGRVQLLAILLPALSVGLFEFVRHRWLEYVLPGWLENTVSALVVAVVVSGFVRIFGGISHNLALEVTRSREGAAIVVERQRICREMHDSVAQALFTWP